MKHNYLIYYVRVDIGNIVGHGNRCIELDNKITKEDIEELYKLIDEEAKGFCDIRIKHSKSIIINIMELTS